MKHIQNGFETIITGNNNESSVWQRLEMWSAAIKAISEAPVIGYSIVDRFNAIKPFLINSIPSYTHPHNDIFATTISIGFTGAIAAMISLMNFSMSLRTLSGVLIKFYLVNYVNSNIDNCQCKYCFF